MDVFDDGAVPADGEVCLILRQPSGERLAEAARRVGVDVALVEHLPELRHRRPLVHVEGEQISVVAFATDERGRAGEVHLHAGAGGLLVLWTGAPDAAATAGEAQAGAPDPTPTIRDALARLDGHPGDALATALLVLAQMSDDAVQLLGEGARRLDEGRTRLSSGPQRRDIAQMRRRLFFLQQLWTAHAQVLAPDDLLAGTLATAARRRLHRARAVFESSGTMAAQLYALLGDTLYRHSTAVNERLTLVTVVFLPLTVSTGFFGMNLGWMIDRIGSPAAFVWIGIVLTGVLISASLLGARWLVRG
jgi:CorA-like Mg2+ transporter protein